MNAKLFSQTSQQNISKNFERNNSLSEELSPQNSEKFKYCFHNLKFISSEIKENVSIGEKHIIENRGKLIYIEYVKLIGRQGNNEKESNHISIL